METIPLTNEQQQTFNRCVDALNKINMVSNVVLRQAAAIETALKWFHSQTGAMPPSIRINSDILGKIRGESATLKQQVDALSYGFELLQTKSAALQPSSKFPGDMDIVTNIIPVTDEIKDHIYKRDSLGAAFLIPFIPLMIKAGTVVVTAVLAYGITKAITETQTKTERIKMNVAKVQADIERDISKDPTLFKTWSNYKAKTMQTDDWIGSIQKIGGGIIMFALIAVAGAFLFKYLGKGGNEK